MHCEAKNASLIFTNFIFFLPSQNLQWRFFIKTILFTLIFTIHALKNYQTIMIFIIIALLIELFILFILKNSNLYLNFIVFYLFYLKRVPALVYQIYGTSFRVPSLDGLDGDLSVELKILAGNLPVTETYYKKKVVSINCVS